VKRAVLTPEDRLELIYEDGEGNELAKTASVAGKGDRRARVTYEELMERGNAEDPEAVKYAVYRVVVGGMPPMLCLLSEELPDSEWTQGM